MQQVSGLDVLTRSEDQLQSKFWFWAWNTYPQYRKLMWAVPNDAHVSPFEASRLKSCGLLSGVWDMHCFYQGAFHIIEAKVGKNQLTRDRVVKGKKVYGQYEWGELMASHGAIRHIYRTLEEGQQMYREIFGVP